MCQTLKEEWQCLDVQAGYRNIGRDPKDISKNQFGLGLLPCNSDCKSKVQVVDSVLQSRKPKVEVTCFLSNKKHLILAASFISQHPYQYTLVYFPFLL